MSRMRLFEILECHWAVSTGKKFVKLCDNNAILNLQGAITSSVAFALIYSNQT